MKYIFTFLLSISLVSTFYGNINFPDSNLKQAILNQYPSFGNDINETEALSVFSLNISNSNVSSLDGIQYFKNLDVLDISNNNISQINNSHTSTLTNLRILIANDNNISYVDVRACRLWGLRLYNNPLEYAYLIGRSTFQLEAIYGISFDKDLIKYVCISSAQYGTQTTNVNHYTATWRHLGEALHLDQCTITTPPICEIINFTDPNFKNALLNYDDNGDGEIDTCEAEDITYLQFFSSSWNITNIDGIEFFINLKTFRFINQNVKHYNFDKNLKLEFLEINDRTSESIDISNNTEIKTLSITNSLISEIDTSNNTKIEKFKINNTHISEINTSTLINLQELKIQWVDTLENLDLSNNINLLTFWLEIRQSPISNIDLSNNTLLEYLLLISNNISNLNLAKNSNLKYFLVTSPSLIEIDLSVDSLSVVSISCPLLETLYMKGDHEFYYSENFDTEPNQSVGPSIYLNTPQLELVCIDPILNFNEFKTYIQNDLNYTNCVVTNNDDCSEDTNASNKYFTLSPNPAIHTINLIRVDNDITIRTAGIYTLAGVLIKKVPISFNDGVIPFTNLTTSLNPSNLLSGANSAFIDISDLLSGQYILYTPTNFGKFYTNFIKL